MNARAILAKLRHKQPPTREELAWMAQALADGVAMSVIEAAQKSPVYKLAVDWQLALPLHPEYRTLPMVWYVPHCRRSRTPPPANAKSTTTQATSGDHQGNDPRTCMTKRSVAHRSTRPRGRQCL